MAKKKSIAEIAELGRKLRQARERTGMSLAAVAKRAEITPGFLNKVERGVSCPSAIVVARLSKVLHEDLSSLLDHVMTVEEKWDAKLASLSEKDKSQLKIWGQHPFQPDFETKVVLLKMIEDILESNE